jgi:4a-hydroxytetrahydrobiopterin dehydratase
MSASNTLARKHCTPCEGGTPALPPDRAVALLAEVPGWTRAADGRRIRREWKVRDFAAGMEFFRRVAEVAEAEDHHPDLHLTDYRQVAIELSTHATGGLTENDFILAAKINELPVELKK